MKMEQNTKERRKEIIKDYLFKKRLKIAERLSKPTEEELELGGTNSEVGED